MPAVASVMARLAASGRRSIADCFRRFWVSSGTLVEVSSSSWVEPTSRRPSLRGVKTWAVGVAQEMGGEGALFVHGEAYDCAFYRAAFWQFRWQVQNFIGAHGGAEYHVRGIEITVSGFNAGDLSGLMQDF